MMDAAIDGDGCSNGGQKIAHDDDDDGDGIGGSGLEAKLKRGLISSFRCGGTRTPPPAWKLELDADVVGPSRHRSSAAEVSARKLGAILWEIQEMIPAAVSRHRRRCDGGRHSRTVAADEPRGREREVEVQGLADTPHSANSLRRHIASSQFQHHKLVNRDSHPIQPESSSSYSGSMELAVLNQSVTPSTSLNLRGRCGESQCGFKTSTELLKVLNRIWNLEEQNASNVSLIKDLKVELQNAHIRIKELTQEKQSCRRQIDHLVKQDRENSTLESLTHELENERRLRRHSESLHRKLGKELTDVKLYSSKAVKNLERQIRTNELLEDLCDEFAKGIKDYENEVRELKCGKPSEPKPDKMILHLSEAWLDERLQVRTNIASGVLSEKGTIIERLEGEIKSFLKSRQSIRHKHDLELQQGRKDDNCLRRQSLESVHLIGNTSAPRDAEGDDSISNDLHCFELNVALSNRQNYNLSKLDGDGGNEHQDSKRESVMSKKKKRFWEKMKSHNAVNLQERLQEQTGITTSNLNDSYVPDIVHETQLHDEGLISKERSNFQATMRPKAEISHHLIKDAVEKITEVHEDYKMLSDANGVESRSCFPRRGNFSLTGDGHDPSSLDSVSSPVRQWPYKSTKAADFQISECSSPPTRSVRKSTLKAKLLEARLEGKHARLKASNSSSRGIMHQRRS